MRVIAGIHKGRNISPTKGKEVRPTTGRTREALFSILSSGQFLQNGHPILTGARVADICCGTGALGLESLSRGAESVIFIDKENDHLQAVRESVIRFGEEENSTIMRADIASLPACTSPRNLIFLDPPYNSGLLPATLKGLVNRNWLEKGATLIVEMGKKESLALPEGFTLLAERLYGKTKLMILEWQ